MAQEKLTDDVFDDIDLLLDQVDELSKLDCNATTDLISYELEREGIDHVRMCGSVVQVRSGEAVFPHCWIELDNGQILDIRLQKYFPYAEEVPHGRFRSEVAYIYRGSMAINERIPEDLLNAMAA
jgi:hypothetical protein